MVEVGKSATCPGATHLGGGAAGPGACAIELRAWNAADR